MEKKILTKKLELKGKVAHIIEKSGEKVISIFIESSSLDFVLSDDEDINLGDVILLEASIKIKSITDQ